MRLIDYMRDRARTDAQSSAAEGERAQMVEALETLGVKVEDTDEN